MTIEEILMGRRRGGDADDGYPGLIPLVKSYLELIEADTPTTCLVDRHVVPPYHDHIIFTSLQYTIFLF